VGAVIGEAYLDLHAASGGKLPATMIEFLEQGEAAMESARALSADGASGHENLLNEHEVELLAPVPKPGKIMHTSCNFSAHLSELATWSAPEWQSHNWGDFHFEHPTGFLEAPSSVVPSGAGVKVPHFTKQLDYEIEVGIIIGKEAFRVSKEEALDYVAGLTIFNDLSARDIQSREHSNKVILLGKSFDGSCPFGPWLVTLDEVGKINDLKMVLTLNGEERQNSSTANMVYKVAELVSWWSNTTLQPGDIITTGSPPGVIAGMPDPVYLKPGDRIDARVEKLGTLTTFIVE
jgi:2-keto-4-pentenoate hydratase/2-oxohepta-3-ene-1,7-dioic acid hydratase in catechol pathway